MGALARGISTAQIVPRDSRPYGVGQIRKTRSALRAVTLVASTYAGLARYIQRNDGGPLALATVFRTACAFVVAGTSLNSGKANG